MGGDKRQSGDWTLLGQLVSNIPILFYTKDAGAGVYRICNGKFAEFCGRSKPEDVVGCTPAELFDQETADRFREQDRQAVESGQPIEFIEKGVDGQGRPYEFKTIKSCFRSASGQVRVLGLSMDISNERRMVEELARERDRAVAAERAKSYFFSAVSHDIRTPLNAIIGFSELLELGVDDPAERRRYLSTIRSSGRVLMNLIDDVLDLSKLELGKMPLRPEPVNLKLLISEVIGAFAVNADRRHIGLIVEAQGLPRLQLDPHRMRQVLFNLVGNAMKFTEKGFITVRAQYRDRRLVLEVEDTGIGIAAEDISKVMDPFVQLQPDGEKRGTGLGLPICRQIAALMGGDLAVVSELGRGTVFTLVVPDVEEAQTAEFRELGMRTRKHSVSRRLAPLARREALRVLVVDDSSVNLSVMKALLARAGVREVATAANGREALEKLGADVPCAFDLVLTDLWMPELDGEGLLKRILAEPAWRELPVVAITADVEAQKDYVTKGFAGLLLKPLTLDKLKDLLGIA